MSDYAEVLRVLDEAGGIGRDDVRRWIAGEDLLTWSAVYAVMDRAWSRIEPEMPAEEQVAFMLRYLLCCVEENPAPGEFLHGGFQAAWQLASSLKEWRRRGGRVATLARNAVAQLERLYRGRDAARRNRVLCGVLEHAFEDPEVRPWFAQWDRDCELREAYRLASEWGRAKERP
jgi:hypothetical protein